MGYDYVELGPSKVVTVRKNHRCTWCAELVLKGSKAVSGSGVFDDRLQRDWLHPECNDAHKRLDWNEYPDGYEFGAFVRGQTYVPGDEPAAYDAGTTDEEGKL